MRIIIADDHELFRIGLRSVLKKFDFVTKIHEAENGKEVIDEMIQQNYDVIFMDLTMPIMNGIDATRVVKRDFPHEVFC